MTRILASGFDINSGKRIVNVERSAACRGHDELTWSLSTSGMRSRALEGKSVTPSMENAPYQESLLACFIIRSCKRVQDFLDATANSCRVYHSEKSQQDRAMIQPGSVDLKHNEGETKHLKGAHRKSERATEGGHGAWH